jgi:hypothetical protein
MLDFRAEPGTVELKITLPEGKSAEELINQLVKEVNELPIEEFHGEILLVNGRVTTPMAAYIGHYFAHICKEVKFYVPMEKAYVKAVWH